MQPSVSGTESQLRHHTGHNYAQYTHVSLDFFLVDARLPVHLHHLPVKLKNDTPVTAALPGTNLRKSVGEVKKVKHMTERLLLAPFNHGCKKRSRKNKKNVKKRKKHGKNKKKHLKTLNKKRWP